MIKFGMHLFTFTERMDDSALDILRKLKEMGYDGCEVPLVAEQLHLIDPKKVRARLKELDMHCVTGTGITNDMSIISEDKDVRTRGIDHVKRCIDMTSEMGAALMCGSLYGPFGIRPKHPRTQAQWDRSVESLRECARHAAKHGVTIGLEPLNRYEHFFINTAADAVKLIEDIGEPNVRVHLDTYHMNIEEKDIYRTVVATGAHLCHVHTSENDRGIPGTGHVDWDGLCKGLFEINYDGWIVLESFFKSIPEIADFTPIWRMLAPSADVLAKQGLEYLKGKIKQYRKE
jgi:D-psicose/D-tagatose/L-ribulose 3-epimerase